MFINLVLISFNVNRYTRKKKQSRKRKRISTSQSKDPNHTKRKKQVQWLDKSKSFQSSYNTNLKQISSLWNKISKQQQDFVNSFTNGLSLIKNSDKCVQYENESVSKFGMQSLSPSKWITDEIVNMYCKLLADRDSQLLKSHLHSNPNVFMHTHFYTLLKNRVSNDNYWERKQQVVEKNLFEVNKIFIPINLNCNHWILVVVSMQLELIEGYDSMYTKPTRRSNTDIHIAMTTVKNFLERQYEKQYNSSLSTSWRTATRSAGAVPFQENDTDCGVFMMAYMDMISVGDDLNFSQININDFRARIKLSILNKNCLL